MSSLTSIDKRFFEKILGMTSGYVLDFTDATFEEFFARYEVDIHGKKFQTYGTSKAKKMRAFWEQESDQKVATVLDELLASHETNCELNHRTLDDGLLKKCRVIIARLSGKEVVDKDEIEVDFLDKEFTIPNIHLLPVEAQVATIIEARLEEARKALKAKAHLSVIFLCGSILEGVLLGTAQQNPARFNQSNVSPKDGSGKVKQFHEWSLAQFIYAACDVGFLKLDIQKFSHGLRDFRNYIHPYQQMTSGFTPDEHTAKVCFQVLKAALASLAGER